MSHHDPELERLLADTDAQLPPPPSRALDLEQLRTRRLRRRGLTATLGILGLAGISSLSMWSSRGPAADPTTADAAIEATLSPGAGAIRALQTAARDLGRRLRQGDSIATSQRRNLETRARQHRVEVQLRSQLAAARADAAVSFIRTQENKR